MATTGLYQQQKTQQKQYSLYTPKQTLTRVFSQTKGLPTPLFLPLTSLVNPTFCCEAKPAGSVGTPCLSWPTCWWHTFRPDLAPSSQLRCWSPRCKVAVHPGPKKTPATWKNRQRAVNWENPIKLYILFNQRVGWARLGICLGLQRAFCKTPRF